MTKKILYRDKGTTPYLIRYTLFKCRLFSIKIHRTLQSDTADLHDHPWSFISIMLKGGYYETRKEFSQGKLIERTTWYRPGSILFRKAQIPHRLIIPEGKYALTLIFTSYRWRDWGFVSKVGWTSHKDSLDNY